MLSSKHNTTERLIHPRVSPVVLCLRPHRYIGLCYGTAGVGKTESAKHYTKWYRIETYRKKDGRLNTGEKPKIQMGKLNSILYTPSMLNPPRDLIKEIRDAQRQFSLLKERYI